MTQRLENTESQVEQYLLWSVSVCVLLVLTTPIIVTISTLFPYVVGKAVFSRSLIEIIFAIWLILILYYPRHRPSKSWVLLAFGVWLLVSLIASFTGVSPVRSLWSNYERMQGIVDLAHWFAFILAASSVFRSFSSWKMLFTVNLGVAVLVSILGLIGYYDLTDSILLGSTDRIDSTLGNATYMGAYMMVNVIIGFGLILQSIGSPPVEPNQSGRMRISASHRRRDKREDESFDYLHLLRVFWFIAIILCLWTLWLTATRGAVAGLGVGAIVFVVGYISWGRMRLARRIAYLILAATIVAAALFIIVRFTPILDPLVNSSYMLQRLTSIGTEDSSIKGRISSISAGVRAYQDKPILGWGPDNYLVSWGRYLPSDSLASAGHFDQAHNKVIEELVTKGTIGLLSYLLIWMAMAWVLVGSVKRRQNHEQLWVLTLGVALAAFFVQNLFLFDSPATMVQLAILMAFVVYEEGRARRDAEDEAREREPRASGAQSRVPGWRRRLGSLQISSQFRTPWSAALVAMTVTLLTIWLLFNYNVKPYNAAQAANLSVISTSWKDTADHFHRSEEEFYNLSNLPRRYLIERIVSQVASMTDEEFSQAVDLVDAEEREAMKVEPQNWRLIIELAKFYQQAAIRNSEYVEVARAHADEAIRLAPNTPHTISVMEEQERIENLPES